MKLLIGADLVPTRSNEKMFKEGNVEELVGEKCLEVLNNADYRIFNLEVPLTERERPIDKCGPNLIAHPDTIHGIKEMGVDLFTLANNHIMDQGNQGLQSTLRVLKRNKIDYVGVGNNISEASRSYIIEDENKKIGIYACAQHEFSIARENTPGANPFDPLESLDHIKNLKDKTDYVIVLYHGGIEHYRYPSPYLQKVCRRMVDKGADVVLVQHSHCIGCEEKYEGATIIYGQGNFLFDDCDNEYWNTGILVSVETRSKIIKYIPLEKRKNKVRVPENQVSQKILDDFRGRSLFIQDENNISLSYKKFVEKRMPSYYFSLGGKFSKNIIFRVLNKLSGHKLIYRFYKKNERLALLNYFMCEAHREVIETGLREK